MFQDTATSPVNTANRSDGRLERSAAADIVGDRAPKQRAEKRADQSGRRQQSGLRRPEPEFVRDRRQCRAEHREIGRVERDADRRRE